MLFSASRQSPDLIGYPVIVRPQGFDLEAEQYCKEIAGALLVSKVKTGDAEASPRAEPLEGVVIYFDDKFDRKYADSLAQAFRSAGVNTTIQGTSFVNITPLARSPRSLSLSDQSRFPPTSRNDWEPALQQARRARTW